MSRTKIYNNITEEWEYIDNIPYIIVDSKLSEISTNPIQNNVVKKALDDKQDILTEEDKQNIADLHAKSNYDENNFAEQSYIENRPFYDSRVYGDVITDVTLEYTNVSGEQHIINNELLTELVNSIENNKTFTVKNSSDTKTIVKYQLTNYYYAFLNASDQTVLTYETATSGRYGFVITETIIISYPKTSLVSGEIKQIDNKFIDFSNIESEIEDNKLNKMNKLDPIGNGSFSLNRKVGTTTGKYSFAEGFNTIASGEASHAEGDNTTASALYSHAEGQNSKASGTYSHAEGTSSASGIATHSEGYGSTASGNYSHTEGYLTTASSNYSHIQGKCNIDDTALTYAHIVGNGTSDSSRSNAHTLDWTGNGWFAGDVYVGSTSGINRDSGSKKLVTEDITNNLSNEINTLKNVGLYNIDSNGNLTFSSCESVTIDNDGNLVLGGMS